jgi:hypothetical protein
MVLEVARDGGVHELTAGVALTLSEQPAYAERVSSFLAKQSG